MQSKQNIFIYFLSFVFANFAFAEDPTTSPTNASDSSEWELKGLHLGVTLEEVKTALPNAKCVVEHFDQALASCDDWNNTLAEKKAIVTVKFLDGRAVFISIANIDISQSKLAAAALTQKFGSPKKITTLEGHTSVRHRERSIYTDAEHYLWKDGNTVLTVNPFEWTNKKSGTTYAAVTLMDEEKHDRQWVVRFNNQGKKANDI